MEERTRRMFAALKAAARQWDQVAIGCRGSQTRKTFAALMRKYRKRDGRAFNSLLLTHFEANELT